MSIGWRERSTVVPARAPACPCLIWVQAWWILRGGEWERVERAYEKGAGERVFNSGGLHGSR